MIGPPHHRHASGKGSIIHPLDHPVWNSLRHGWSALAQGDALALRLDPDHGPFAAAATRDDAGRAALAALTPDDGELWMIGPDALSPPPGVHVMRTAMLTQMVADRVTDDGPALPDWHILGEEDGPAMLELALLTKPGPFRRHTHRLGRFIGVRDEDGRLAAMAGERMRLPGFTEVSGVCTHPNWRGRGLAGALMRMVMRAMLDRGETPFLHAYASHDRTIALYRGLGFAVRAELPMMVVGWTDQ
ncbi:GNAT family N-acetyltransferase [Sphingobium sp.]|uniref:GNAT family N-acetyltransferase n=1 Tax=Sphingobium sp. TaxID=1912891 RepID=UPI003B3A3021